MAYRNQMHRCECLHIFLHKCINANLKIFSSALPAIVSCQGRLADSLLSWRYHSLRHPRRSIAHRASDTTAWRHSRRTTANKAIGQLITTLSALLKTPQLEGILAVYLQTRQLGSQHHSLNTSQGLQSKQGNWPKRLKASLEFCCAQENRNHSL